MIVADGVESKTGEVLTSLANSGSTEAIAVAACLNGIAENGEGQESTDFLVGCAQEIVDAALGFIKRVL